LARHGVVSGRRRRALLAEAAVAEEEGDSEQASGCRPKRSKCGDEAPPRALALLQVARLRAGALPQPERRSRRRRRVGPLPVRAAAETLAAEAESELASQERVQPTAGDVSQAEQRVLRLLATRLTQREIANELYVSPNTVKPHARVIYRKLGVRSRAAAVEAARELNLV
jgi:ATP/maltotriose-dependent transcriptional regulator MalT